MVQYRLNIETESRIRWKVYVRFGGEHLEIAHVHMIRRRVLSLHFKFSDLSTIAYNHMMNHHAQPQQDVGSEAGRLFRGESDYPLCSHHLVLTHLQEREVLYLSPCHRIA